MTRCLLLWVVAGTILTCWAVLDSTLLPWQSKDVLTIVAFSSAIAPVALVEALLGLWRAYQRSRRIQG